MRATLLCFAVIGMVVGATAARAATIPIRAEGSTAPSGSPAPPIDPLDALAGPPSSQFT